MDLTSAYSAVRDLPDSVLHREMQQPSGMIPQYLIMGELADRRTIRSGTANPKPPTIAQQLMQGILPPANPTPQPYPMMQSGGYSKGGMIAGINPFNTQAQIMKHPKIGTGLTQEQMNQMNGGLMPLSSPQAPGVASPVQSLSNLMPMPPGSPSAPTDVDSGGLATLLRSRGMA
jgi:hypothetical protein